MLAINTILIDLLRITLPKLQVKLQPYPFCLEFFKPRDLHRHVKSCSGRESLTFKTMNFRVQIRAAMPLSVPSIASNDLKGILCTVQVMRPTYISNKSHLQGTSKFSVSQ